MCNTAMGDAEGNPVDYPDTFNVAVDGQLVANADELVTVERILTLRTAGESLGAIANALNADGVTGKLGGKFYASTFSAIIGNVIHLAVSQ